MARTMIGGQLTVAPVDLRNVARLIEVARGIDDAISVDLESWKDSHCIKVWCAGSDAYMDEADYIYFIDGDGDIQGGVNLVDVPTMLRYVPLTDGAWFCFDEEIHLDRRPFDGSSAEFSALYPEA